MSLQNMTSWTILGRDTSTYQWMQFASGARDLSDYGEMVAFAVYKADDGFDIDAIIIKQYYPGNVVELIRYFPDAVLL